MTRPLRVLAIGHSFVIALNRAPMREAARDPEFEITVASPEEFQGDLRPLRIEPEPPGSPLRLAALPSRFSGRIHFFHYSPGALRRLLRSAPWDCVFCWEEPYTASGWQIARACAAHAPGVPHVFWTAQNLHKRYPPPFGAMERSVLGASAAWVACGDLVAEVLAARGYPRETCRVIPLPVDLTAFRPFQEDERERVRARFGLRPPVVGFLGRFTPDKGLDILMRALEGVDPSLPWSLLLMGSGAYADAVRNWADSRGWEDRVRMTLLRHEEVPEVLPAADLLAAPSRTTPHWREQFGRMIVEAFACGVPVLGSDSGEIPRVIGPAGIVLPEAEPSAWSRALESLLSSPEERARLAALGLERARQFSAPAVGDRYKSLFREVAGALPPDPSAAGAPPASGPAARPSHHHPPTTP